MARENEKTAYVRERMRINEVKEESKDDYELEVKELQEGVWIVCTSGVYKGWEGYIVEVHSKMVTFTPCYRFDKKQKQRRVSHKNAEIITKDKVVAVEQVMESVELILRVARSKFVTRSEWLDLCDEIEKSLFVNRST